MKNITAMPSKTFKALENKRDKGNNVKDITTTTSLEINAHNLFYIFTSQV